jgi:hypothetical protein
MESSIASSQVVWCGGERVPVQGDLNCWSRSKDKTVKYIIRRYLSTLGTEWDLVKETLEKLRQSSRNPVSHTPEGRQLNKSRAMRKKALNHKGEYVVVHMESLMNIRKDYPNYEREKEV